MAKDTPASAVRPFPPGALALRAELAEGELEPLPSLSFGDHEITPLVGRDSLWFRIAGRLMLRTAWSPGQVPRVTKDEDGTFSVTGSLGEHRVALTPEPDDRLVRITTHFTPLHDLLVPEWPRDLYPLNKTGMAPAAEGQVEAAQRGLNSGIVFFTLPDFGTALYFQNLTALNDWHRTGGTAPEGVVGGQWPELGYRPKPFCSEPLPAGRSLVQSDAILTWEPEITEDDGTEGGLFLDLFARAYRRLDDAPATEFHDWPDRCERTARHLARSPKATIEHYGHRYLHPYTASEYPDCMVQLSVAQALNEYGRWRGRPVSLERELLAGMRRFYDPELKTLRRYLPNVGEDKDENQVDSWYLYHPLLNLGRLALAGDEACRALLFNSLDYAIKAARHFKYDWPIMFDVRTLKVIKATREPGGPGQSDVGGIYAYVMLLAHELSGDDRYLREAEKAVAALEGWKFELLYQSNLTAWGAAACVRLWKRTGDVEMLRRTQILLAGFFHNCLGWESEIGAAEHYSTFLGATCLHDGPYMAMYECFESLAAFENLLETGGEDLPDAIRLLTSEYRKYVLHRAWWYFPDALPADLLPPEDQIRNGHIDPKLSFPVEDLYGDGQAPGQVGQEIYGCGAPFAITARAFHDFPGAPFRLFAEYPVVDVETGEGRLAFSLFGAADRKARVRLSPIDGAGKLSVRGARPSRSKDGALTFEADALKRIEITWDI